MPSATLPMFLQMIGVGLGVMAAGFGVLVACIKIARFFTSCTTSFSDITHRGMDSLSHLSLSNEALARYAERQAAAAEATASLVPLLHQISEGRDEMNMTLRAISRKLAELMARGQE